MNIKIKTICLVVLLICAVGFSSNLALADTKTAIQCGVNAANGVNDCTSKPTTSLDDTIATVINVLSSLVGVIAVIMIIIGGYRYITSGGASDKVTSAKNTLLYAVIGLVIVALAQVIVKFVLHHTVK